MPASSAGAKALEGKAAAVMACVQDFREFLIGSDPMQVEHHWQSMYVHSFYRAGPVMGSAISAIDQAMWDIRGKVLGLPVYQLLGGPVDPKGVRGYYHARASTPDQLQKLRQTAVQQGVSCFKTGIPDYYEFIETHAKIKRAVKHMEMLRENLGPDLDIAVDFHAKTSPSVASIIVKEVEPLHLLFIEEPCPPENVKAMARVAKRSTTPIATGERLIAAYGCRELIEMGVVDILQTDMNHVGGITALWKVAAMAEASGIVMAPHACEGPIGAIASVHVDSHAELPHSGNLQRRGTRPQRKGVGGMDGLPHHAHGGWPFSAPNQTRPRLRSNRRGAEEVSVRRHSSHGPRVPPGWFRR